MQKNNFWFLCVKTSVPLLFQNTFHLAFCFDCIKFHHSHLSVTHLSCHFFTFPLNGNTRQVCIDIYLFVDIYLFAEREVFWKSGSRSRSDSCTWTSKIHCLNIVFCNSLKQGHRLYNYTSCIQYVVHGVKQKSRWETWLNASLLHGVKHGSLSHDCVYCAVPLLHGSPFPFQQPSYDIAQKEANTASFIASVIHHWFISVHL